jgi:hypothetical protein
VRAERDAIAARIARGDEDSLVNLLLFGTSFTTAPRVTTSLLEELDRRWNAGDASAQQTLLGAYRRRADDLVTAMAAPHPDERMRFGRSVLERSGHDLATDNGRRRAADYLLSAVVRVRKEAAALAQALETARRLPDSTAAFAEQSRVFRERGLAPDSSVLTQYAVDRAIATLRTQGTLKPGSVTRVAIVGPGLDFADKQEGFDFYEPQSLQPFATIDSLLHSGAAAPGLQVITIDVSERVNGHLRSVIERATHANREYRLVLPHDSGAAWLDAAVVYWRRMGDRIGIPFAVSVPSALPAIRARGVAVRPEIVRRVHVIDANIVLDRVRIPDHERFDLVIATNVLVYYDTFEQTLAASSIASMLRPGGVLVTNNSVLEIPEVPLKSDGYLTVRFSDREGDGEHMVWYRKER